MFFVHFKEKFTEGTRSEEFCSSFSDVPRIFWNLKMKEE
jgi:hypothetical protein